MNTSTPLHQPPAPHSPGTQPHSTPAEPHPTLSPDPPRQNLPQSRNQQATPAEPDPLTAPALLFLLRNSDSLFPTGAYAHSLGMEELARSGYLRDEPTFAWFLIHHILPAAAAVDLPLAAHARRAASSPERWNELPSLNQLAAALRASRELRAASLQTGRRRLATLASCAPSPVIRHMAELAQKDPAFGHAPIVWGAACAEIPEHAALTTLLYQTLATFATAAPKLLRIGQEAVQRALSAAFTHAPEAIRHALQTPLDDIGFFDPLLDIASMRHETATERLFIS